MGCNYRGTHSTTEDGKTCMVWNRFDLSVGEFEGTNTNYCRNPDGDDRPWCMTDEDWSWGYCDIPVCGEGRMNPIFGQEAPTQQALDKNAKRDKFLN